MPVIAAIAKLMWETGSRLRAADGHDAGSDSQQSEVEGESRADKEADPKNVDGFKHGIEAFGAPHRLAERGALQQLQQGVEPIRHVRSIPVMRERRLGRQRRGQRCRRQRCRGEDHAPPPVRCDFIPMDAFQVGICHVSALRFHLLCHETGRAMRLGQARGIGIDFYMLRMLGLGS